MAVCMALIGPPMLRFFDDPQAFRAWVDSHGIWGRVAFVGMVALQVVIALIPGEPLEIGAGYAFGAVEGTLLCLAGTTLGSLLVFGFVRKLGMKAVEPFFSREEIENTISALISLLEKGTGNPAGSLNFLKSQTP